MTVARKQTKLVLRSFEPFESESNSPAARISNTLLEISKHKNRLSSRQGLYDKTELQPHNIEPGITNYIPLRTSLFV